LVIRHLFATFKNLHDPDFTEHCFDYVANVRALKSAALLNTRLRQ
jgi:hypothetical protein